MTDNEEDFHYTEIDVASQSISNITRSFAAMNTSSPKEPGSAVAPGGAAAAHAHSRPNPKIAQSPPSAGKTPVDHHHIQRRRHISEGDQHVVQAGFRDGNNRVVAIGSAGQNVVGGIFAMDSAMIPKGMSSSFGSAGGGVFDHDYQRKVRISCIIL